MSDEDNGGRFPDDRPVEVRYPALVRALVSRAQTGHALAMP
jgi:hypothetical protein